MLILLATIFLVVGLGGMLFIVVKKMPVLAQENISYVKHQDNALISPIKQKIERVIPRNRLHLGNFVKKTLIKTKIFFIKCENKIDSWLQKISQSRKFSEDYWDKIKKK